MTYLARPHHLGKNAMDESLIDEESAEVIVDMHLYRRT